MSTATTSIAAHAGNTCATAPKIYNPYTPEMHELCHVAHSRLLLVVMGLHHMANGLNTGGLDDALSLITKAQHDVETLRSWYLFDLAEGHPTTAQRKGQA